MKKLITICVVVGLILSTTCVSWAVPTVTPPPGAPSWWNADEATGCLYYAYGWWEDDLYPPPGGGSTGWVSPPNDVTHWASNFLENTKYETDFEAGTFGLQVRTRLENEYRPDFKKEIYIYIEGTTSDSNLVNAPMELRFDANEGTFSGSEVGINNGDGTWTYVVSGEIIPQPSLVLLFVGVQGLTSVTNIWAGENCIPEPATVCLLGLGALSLLRRKW